jgi:flagellar hook-associated protein 3 FlgL
MLRIGVPPGEWLNWSSGLQNIDYTQAISQLDMESFVLQATKQSYARISGLSLFNSL